MSIVDPVWVLGALAEFYERDWSGPEHGWFFHPSGADGRKPDDGFDVLEGSYFRPPESLCPLAIVDEDSLACVLLDDINELGLAAGSVVRWFSTDVAPHHQLKMLDIDPISYAESVRDELAARDEGFRRVVDVVGPAYSTAYIERAKRPRDFVVRPVRLACQNVIVALAAFAQDSRFDGLSVLAWQTCEVPHIGTHEANRALAAVTLCDAYQSGGTMEIRFDRHASVDLNGKRKSLKGHPEKRVPASLRRFGRTVGVELGKQDKAAIVPAEARELFLAVVPMPDELAERVRKASDTIGITPERLCFMVLSQIWREIELDFILASSTRAASILRGGAEWTDRPARQAESEICRSAVMAGMFFRRLNATDHAGSSEDGVRIVQGSSVGVEWSVLPDRSSILLTGIDSDEPLPWSRSTKSVAALEVSFAPSPRQVDLPSPFGDGTPQAVLIPADAPTPDGEMMVLRCPDRLPDIDKAVESKLVALSIARA